MIGQRSIKDVLKPKRLVEYPKCLKNWQNGKKLMMGTQKTKQVGTEKNS